MHPKDESEEVLYGYEHQAAHKVRCEPRDESEEVVISLHSFLKANSR